jgi:hypothetical protein
MLLKLYLEAQETIPTTYPRIQYAIEAVLGSTGDGPYTTYPRIQYAIEAVLRSTGDDPYYLS